MDLFEKREVVRKLVTDYFDNNALNVISNQDVANWESEKIIDMGTSILCMKWNIGHSGGGFAEAVVDNNLMRAVSNADGINLQALKFYTMLMYNVGAPSEIFENNSL